MPNETDPGFRGNGYKLTKVGTDQINLNGGQANVTGSTVWDSDLGDVDVLEGTLSFERRMGMGRVSWLRLPSGRHTGEEGLPAR